MRKIQIRTQKNSYYLRKVINGVVFQKSWGTIGDAEDYAYMQLVAVQADREIKNGEFNGFDKWFQDCESWDRQSLLKAIENLPKNNNSQTLAKHLKRYTGQVSTPKQVDKFLGWLGVSEPTKARYLSVIRKVAPKITQGLSYSQSKGNPDPFQDNEIELIRGFGSSVIRCVTTVWIDLGLRTGELAAIEPSWIDWENNKIQVRGTLSRETGEIKECKSGHNRVIPFNAKTKDYLLLMNDKKNPFGILKHQSNFINRHWVPTLKLAQVRYRKPYCLRHTCASRKIIAYKGDLARVAYEMGHRIDTLAEHYAGVIHAL